MSNVKLVSRGLIWSATKLAACLEMTACTEFSEASRIVSDPKEMNVLFTVVAINLLAAIILKSIEPIVTTTTSPLELLLKLSVVNSRDCMPSAFCIRN